MSQALAWLKLAEQSRKDADALFGIDAFRSCISRAYYSAFQAATAMLHQSRGVTPPIVTGEQREAWAHGRTPDYMKTHMKKMVKDKRFRNELASTLGALY